MKPANPIKYIPLEDAERHFVLGDIHGKFKELNILLDKINYDPASDNIYTVGDMIDRGPDSVEVLDFFILNESNYSILGNHEHMAVTPAWRNIWIHNGGISCELSMLKHGHRLNWLKNQINTLPRMIEVGEPDEEHSFRILHADMHPQWSDKYVTEIFDQMLPEYKNDRERTLWGRINADAYLKHGKMYNPDFHVERNYITYMGHTPTKEVVSICDMRFTDTFLSRTLTIVNTATEEVFSTKV